MTATIFRQSTICKTQHGFIPLHGKIIHKIAITCGLCTLCHRKSPMNMSSPYWRLNLDYLVGTKSSSSLFGFTWSSALLRLTNHKLPSSASTELWRSSQVSCQHISLNLLIRLKQVTFMLPVLSTRFTKLDKLIDSSSLRPVTRPVKLLSRLSTKLIKC